MFLISCATEKESITEMKWFLQEIDGDREVIIQNDNVPYLEFDLESSKAGGNASCNRFFADYHIVDNTLNFGLIATTKMYCADTSDQEYRFLHALERVDSFKISDNILYLFEGDIVILVFSSNN